MNRTRSFADLADVHGYFSGRGTVLGILGETGAGKSTLFRIMASVTRLSKGQQGKLKIVFAFSWPARLVLMDEPLGGIDPPARKKIINSFFNEYRFGEQTIIISTHIVNEVEEFVEDVIYLKKGEVVLSGQADRLREEKKASLVGIFEEIAG